MTPDVMLALILGLGIFLAPTLIVAIVAIFGGG